MKITILQENLSKALSIASRFVSSKVQLPVLSNFLLETKNGQLVVSATNLDLGVSVSVPAKVEKEGSIAVPARVLLELVAGLPKDKIELIQENTALKVVSGGHRSLVNGMMGSEFPKLPEPPAKANLEFDYKTLSDIASQICFSSSQDEGRPALTGILVGVKEKEFVFVATDGFRLSIKKVQSEGNKNKDDVSILIPSRAFLEAGKISSEKTDKNSEVAGLSIIENGNQVLFSWGDVVLSSRVIDGKFPPYEKIIPEKATTRVSVDKEEFQKSIKLASIFARESANIIKIKTGPGKIKISANTPQVGENESEIEAKTEGDSNEIAFNSRYITEYLGGLTADRVEMEIVGPLNPCVFKNPKDTSYLHIIMPVRVQG